MQALEGVHKGFLSLEQCDMSQCSVSAGTLSSESHHISLFPNNEAHRSAVST